MRRPAPFRVAIAATLLAGFGLTARASQQPQVQISAAVDIVRLRVAVVHTAGGEIPELSSDDFTVYDNGVRQNVRLLHRPADTPLRVALVIDASPSLRPWWRTVQRTAITFLAKLGITGCAYVLPFSDGIGPGRWGRYTANNWREFLDRAPKGAGTSLHDALVVALDQLADADEMAIEASQPPAERDAEDETFDDPLPPTTLDPAIPSRADLMESVMRILAQIVRVSPPTHLGNCDLRYTPAAPTTEDEVALPDDESIKAVLLLSDGADTTSIATAQDAIDAASIANVPVFPVMLGTANRDPVLEALLGEIARATGGIVTKNVSVRSLGGDYDRVLGYLRSSYVLVYDPNEPAESIPNKRAENIPNTPAAESIPNAMQTTATSWHEIRVELRRPLLRAIVRPGYYR